MVPVMKTVLLLTLAAACGGEPPDAPVSRVWPSLGTMMSAAAWGPDTAQVGRALDAVRDSVDGTGQSFDSLRTEIRRRTGVALAARDIGEGEALDRAARRLAGVADSALLDLGGQYLWVGAQGTRRTVGIADPANPLKPIASVELHAGSVSTASDAARGISVTVLAPSGVAADAWATALLKLGCAGTWALTGVSVVCADSGRVGWSRDLDGRVLVATP
jgi:thiamine biosynthesis lipoprotein ApbE